MKIEHSDVSLFSSHKKYHEIKEEESFYKWNNEKDAPQRLQRGDRFELSENLKKLEHTKGANSSEDDLFDIPLDAKMMSILRALEALIGKKINISFYRKGETTELQAPKQEVQNSEAQRLGWGVEYSYSRSETKEEMLKFSAKGSVSTQDGREIDFKLALSMQKSSITHESISFKAGDALIDPLVLNFANNTVTMSDIKHNFDLDLDGKSDEFSFVGRGSGFLALDKNNDGIINDGSELFGPTLGNGFLELSAYDSDNNNWIDENDAVFEKLLIWTKDEDGNEQLFRLKDKDVGALYLDRIKTDFDLEDSANNMMAKMRESSIYLRENGGAGTLQEIDLVI